MKKGEIFLWNELPEETKQRLLDQARKKVGYTQSDFDKERARIADLKRTKIRPRQNFETIWKEMAGEGAIDLGDGWCRIFTLDKYGRLQVDCSTRFEAEWLQGLSREVKNIQEMTKWPRGNLPKSNPWKSPHFERAVVALPTWHEEHQQFQIAFDGPIYQERWMSKQALERREKKRAQGKSPKGRPWATCTFYFGPDIVKDERLEEMWTPIKQMRARPWKRGDPVLSKPRARVPSFWLPDKYDLGILMQAKRGEVSPLEAKTHLIRRWRRERREVVPIDVKETVEFWMRSMSLPDFRK